MRDRYGEYPPYVPVAKRREMALAHAQKLSKKGTKLNPVTIAGRVIASSWWGKSWCENLERYADFAYRLDRGRTYVRNGMVLDMSVTKGEVKALVAGSRAIPYRVTVKVTPLAAPVWARLQQLAAGRIDTLHALLAGNFPEELKGLFFDMNSGLFPKPADITLDCTCPDWASMCKHVAAALYGVGARVDSDPSMFFVLRGVSMDELVGKVVARERTRLLRKKPSKSSRVLRAADDGGQDLSALFGISIDSSAAATGEQSDAPSGPSKREIAPKSPAKKRAGSSRTPKTRSKHRE